jgi:hypothetical protein
MLLLILFILFYIFVEQKGIKVTADELVQNYSSNPDEADKKYLNNDIELTGQVKSYYEFENENSLLELQTDINSINLYCIIKEEFEVEAESLSGNTDITIVGKCLGIKDLKFSHSIYIEAEKIK